MMHRLSRRDFLASMVLGAAALPMLNSARAKAAPAASRPNILLILADDLGYADVGFQGSRDVPTPNLDALARRSVRCTSGYVSHPFCSPTRAGLLTGRYQQRFGHENNPAWLPDDPTVGLPLSQVTLPQALKTAGYVTGAVGKWHLGGHPSFHPLKRGFDEYYGVLGGGHQYLPGPKGGAEYTIPIDRNGVKEPHTGYLTEAFGREAVAFVKRHAGAPWFLYLAFNAPHTPLQAPESYQARIKPGAIDTPERRTYAAMMAAEDDAIGATLAALRETGADANTLIFFMSDNGGPYIQQPPFTSNSPLRGAKGSTYEGGIRVPFLVSWPGRLPEGRDYAQPIISLDVFKTALAVSGAKPPAGVQLDGENIIPFLSGKKSGAPHERLFWRTGGGDQIAVRQGPWKWRQAKGQPAELYNLDQDIGEATNVIEKNPKIAAELEAAAMAWNKELVPPIFQSPRPAGKKKAQGKGKKKQAGVRPSMP